MNGCKKGFRFLYRNNTPELTEIVDNKIDKNVYLDSRSVTLNRSDKSIIASYAPDKISDNSYTTSSSFKTRLNDLVKDTTNAIVKNKTANLAMVGGALVGLAANYFSGDYAGTHHFTYFGIDWTSYLCESLPNLVTSAVIFWRNAKKEGQSNAHMFGDMAVVGAVTTLLSVGIYKPFRDIISNNLMNSGVASGIATLKAQLYLIGEYMILSGTASYYALKKLGRFDWKEKEKQKELDIESNLVPQIAVSDYPTLSNSSIITNSNI